MSTRNSTTTPHRFLRRRSILVLIVPLLLVSLVGCQTSPEDAVLLNRLINYSRTTFGADPLRADLILMAQADKKLENKLDGPQCRFQHFADWDPHNKTLQFGAHVKGSVTSAHSAIHSFPSYWPVWASPNVTGYGVAATRRQCGGETWVWVVYYFSYR